MIDKSLEILKPNILIYQTNFNTPKRIQLGNKKNYQLDFGNLGKNDGLISIQIKKDSLLVCSTNLYFSNGFIIGNNYVIKKDSSSHCSIYLAN